jgi:hypothetical protein
MLANVSDDENSVLRRDLPKKILHLRSRSVIDATGEGVHARNTQRLFFDNECSIHVLRLRAGISPSQLDAVVTYIRGQVGTQYSAKEAVLTVLGGARAWTKKQFCSRLVAQAFESAGIALVFDSNYCSPADIKDSPHLIAVESPTVAVTAGEAAFWEGQVDVPQWMRDATNTILYGAQTRSWHSDVQ